jgi:hypothetical protein
VSAPQKFEPCDVCGGAGGLESFYVHGALQRWRVKCAKCGLMTPHFCDAALALAVWNERTGQRDDKLAG